jgi:hypothetical protein
VIVVVFGLKHVKENEDKNMNVYQQKSKHIENKPQKVSHHSNNSNKGYFLLLVLSASHGHACIHAYMVPSSSKARILLHTLSIA